jgi:hypothetical protein
MDDEDWDDEEDPMSTMPKVEDYDDMEEFGQAVADWQEEQDMEDDEDEEDDEDWDDEDLDDEDEDDDETDVDVDVEESYRGSSVREGRKGKSRRKKVNEARNEFKERMLNLSE